MQVSPWNPARPTSGLRLKGYRTASFNDPMAVGALRELHTRGPGGVRRRGVRVPADIAVAGFDDLGSAASPSPP